jgi:hypothetical protein
LSYVNSRGVKKNSADNFNDNQNFIIGWTNRFGFMAKIEVWDANWVDALDQNRLIEQQEAGCLLVGLC